MNFNGDNMKCLILLSFYKEKLDLIKISKIAYGAKYDVYHKQFR